jgi:5-methylcytosine-specific restriction endonuclease McrA
MKPCARCGIPKPLSEFNRSAKSKDGRRSQCKDCQRAYQRQYNTTNKRRIRAYQRDWCKRHPEKRTRKATWPSSQPEYYRERRKRNPLRSRETSRRYRQSERGRITKRNNWRNRNAKKQQAEGVHTTQDIQRQYERQHGKCYWCNKPVGKTYHVDHVIPLDRGGSNGPDNLVIACAWCNESKNNRLPHEWHGNGGKLL